MEDLQETGKETEFDMGEGKKPELVPCVAEDIDAVAKGDKDWLRKFTKKKFGYDLDLGAHIKDIRKELTRKVQVSLNMIIDSPGTDDEEVVAIEKVIPRYLLHPVNRRINEATPELLARGDMIPCTKDGVSLVKVEEDKDLGMLVPVKEVIREGGDDEDN